MKTSTLPEVARAVAALRCPALIAVDGVDGAGKTTFARALAHAVESVGRPSLVVHADDFLAPRAVRYRSGRDSPEGFFHDTYDLAALRRHVLDPCAPGGDRRIRRRVFDHRADRPVDAPVDVVPPDGVVVVEGMFLHRDELRARWDWSVFLDVPFTETARRMAVRDGSHPDPEHPSMRRYVQGQRLYLASCHPVSRASLVLSPGPEPPRAPVRTSRLVLTPVGADDVDDLVVLSEDPAVATWTGPWTPATVAAWAADMATRWERDAVGKWTARLATDGSLVGRGGLSLVTLGEETVLELGWAVRDALTGQGYATEIGRAAIAWAATHHPTRPVVAFTEVHNHASRAVMDRLGMTHVGTLHRPGLVEGRTGLQPDAPFALYRLPRSPGP